MGTTVLRINKVASQLAAVGTRVSSRLQLSPVPVPQTPWFNHSLVAIKLCSLLAQLQIIKKRKLYFLCHLSVWKSPPKSNFTSSLFFYQKKVQKAQSYFSTNENACFCLPFRLISFFFNLVGLKYDLWTPFCVNE